MTNGGRPTIADVAAAAGVSRSTASRAMSGSGYVSPPTRELVWAAAKRLAFEPNELARSLRVGASTAIGIVLPDVANAFYATALKAAQQVLEDAGYHVLVVNTERTASRERAELQTLHAKRVVGLLVSSYGGYQDVGVPTVFFDDVVPGEGVGGVALDNGAGIRLLVEHLATEHAHERIAYIGPPETNEEGLAPRVFVGRERIEAFRTAVGDVGLALPGRFIHTTEGRSFHEAARQATRELLALAQPPTAIVAGSDTIAIGALELTRELGVRVPEELALVSFDEPLYAHLIDPPITSLDRHDAELGRRAAEMLVRALAGDRDDPPVSDQPQTVRVPLELCIRRSCGCRGDAT
jgi:LacI family transcriptional regulator, galactose operon repressor